LKGNKGKDDESFTEIIDEMQKYRENESIREARLLVNRMDTSAYILTTRIFPSLPYTRSNINA
jgi:hypothetical protein